VKITRSAMAAVRAHVAEGYPNEVCGMLVAAAGSDLAVEAHRVRNTMVERARDRYLMDPRDQIRIERDCDERNLAVIGYYHSHPDHPARASVTDAGASWAGPGYLIVSCHGGEPREANLFVAEQDGGPMHQVAYELVEDPTPAR
jgi:proteasome lid subunit RPN8/RPN11